MESMVVYLGSDHVIKTPDFDFRKNSLRVSTTLEDAKQQAHKKVPFMPASTTSLPFSWTEEVRMEQQEKLTVLLIEPECYPKTIEIEPGLEPLQKAVGGWIEAVYPWEDKAAIIINEEGKLDQLPLNRALRTEDGEIYDITAGNMLIVGLGEEDFSSLTKDQLAHYEKLFHQPESFIRLGGHLMAIPIPDKEVRQAEKARKQEAAKKAPSHDAR